jgi:hypothetical protein
MTATAEIPSAVRLQLRREACFGCCACGHPFVEYHHIVPRATEKHHRPEDMMALCPNHHHQANIGAIDVEAQREWKRVPFNRTQGLAKGQLTYPGRFVAVRVGSTLLIGNGSKLAIDGTSLLRIRVGRDRRLLVSMDLRDDDDRSILNVVDNEWVTGESSPWDIEFRYNYMRVRSELRKIDLEIDARSEPLSLSGMLRLRRHEFRLQDSGLSIVNPTGGGVSIVGIAMVLSRLEYQVSSKRLAFAPDPGFGAGFMVAGQTDLLQRSLQALDKHLRSMKLGRNDPCPCASGQKWKDCCSPA